MTKGGGGGGGGLSLLATNRIHDDIPDMIFWGVIFAHVSSPFF